MPHIESICASYRLQLDIVPAFMATVDTGLSITSHVIKDEHSTSMLSCRKLPLNYASRILPLIKEYYIR